MKIYFSYKPSALLKRSAKLLIQHKKVSSMTSTILTKILASSVAIADTAGQIVRDVMKKGELDIVEKTGKNDLQTKADRSAQKCIIASLAKQYPHLTVVGEEGEQDLTDVPAEWIVTTADPEAAKMECPEKYKDVKIEQLTVWVDPLDGTQEYTEGLLDHVTVLIGIVVGKEAVAGVIHQPYWNYKSSDSSATLGRTIFGLVGAGVFGLNPTSPPPGLRILTTTRSHGTGLVQEALDALNPDGVLRVGGAGHKVILLLEGQAHAWVFPSPGCKKWDTCAPEAVLHAMGGKLTDIHGNQYDYHSTVEHTNTEGVLATRVKGEHVWYLDNIPQEVKQGVRNSYKK